MRHVPEPVDRVAVKAAAKVVVHPSGGHAPQGGEGH